MTTTKRRPTIRQAYRDEIAPQGYKIIGSMYDATGFPVFTVVRDGKWFIALRNARPLAWTFFDFSEYAARDQRIRAKQLAEFDAYLNA